MNRNFIIICTAIILLTSSDSLHACCRRYCNSADEVAPSLAPEPSEDASNATCITSFSHSVSTQSNSPAISPEISLATIHCARVQSRRSSTSNSLSISALSASSAILEELFSSCESLKSPESSR